MYIKLQYRRQPNGDLECFQISKCDTLPDGVFPDILARQYSAQNEYVFFYDCKDQIPEEIQKIIDKSSRYVSRSLMDFEFGNEVYTLDYQMNHLPPLELLSIKSYQFLKEPIISNQTNIDNRVKIAIAIIVDAIKAEDILNALKQFLLAEGVKAGVDELNFFCPDEKNQRRLDARFIALDEGPSDIKKQLRLYGIDARDNDTLLLVSALLTSKIPLLTLAKEIAQDRIDQEKRIEFICTKDNCQMIADYFNQQGIPKISDQHRKSGSGIPNVFTWSLLPCDGGYTIQYHLNRLSSSVCFAFESRKPGLIKQAKTALAESPSLRSLKSFFDNKDQYGNDYHIWKHSNGVVYLDNFDKLEELSKIINPAFRVITAMPMTSKIGAEEVKSSEYKQRGHQGAITDQARSRFVDEKLKHALVEPAVTSGRNANCFFQSFMHVFIQLPTATLTKLQEDKTYETPLSCIAKSFNQIWQKSLKKPLRFEQIINLAKQLHPLDRECLLGPVLRHTYNLLVEVGAIKTQALKDGAIVLADQIQAFSNCFGANLCTFMSLDEFNKVKDKISPESIKRISDNRVEIEGRIFFCDASDNQPTLWDLNLVYEGSHLNYTMSNLGLNKQAQEKVIVAMSEFGAAYASAPTIPGQAPLFCAKDESELQNEIVKLFEKTNCASVYFGSGSPFMNLAPAELMRGYGRKNGSGGGSHLDEVTDSNGYCP